MLSQYDAGQIAADTALATIREHLDDITAAGQRKRFEAATRFIYAEHITPLGRLVLEQVLAD
ncbi:hypothetical protein ASF62_10925 [Leifsonia sp. Leaf325]|nr:hypothetical protein [Leifsonia sp. Leaf325]KQQ94574.1 hypothetical protein ASF62_10925 [Leifsonia sp. Leaf325]